MVTLASTCRKDPRPRTAETMRKDCGKTAGTVQELSFKAVTLRRCRGNSAERLRKHCGHNAEHGRSRCGRDVGVTLLGHPRRVQVQFRVPERRSLGTRLVEAAPQSGSQANIEIWERGMFSQRILSETLSWPTYCGLCPPSASPHTSP